jgi:hypothetical protein
VLRALGLGKKPLSAAINGSGVILVELSRQQRQFLGAGKKSTVGTRLAHQPFMSYAHQIADIDGNIGVPMIALSPLAIMVRHGTITAQLAAIGDTFNAQFRLASLDTLKAAAVDRLPTNLASQNWHGGGNERARSRIGAAITLLGGDQSIAAHCAWHVLGMECSVREWARMRLAGKVDRAVGVVIATLSALEPQVSAWH